MLACIIFSQFCARIKVPREKIILFTLVVTVMTSKNLWISEYRNESQNAVIIHHFPLNLLLASERESLHMATAVRYEITQKREKYVLYAPIDYCQQLIYRLLHFSNFLMSKAIIFAATAYTRR